MIDAFIEPPVSADERNLKHRLLLQMRNKERKEKC